MIRSISRQLRRLRRDEKGSMTVELMLWLPFLILWLVFSLAVFNAYLSRNQTAKAAHTLADIVSRKTDWSEAAFTELLGLEQKLLSFANAGFDLRVSSIQRVGSDHVVLWSSASEGLPLLTSGALPVDRLPTMADLDTVMYTEVSVPWTPFAQVPGLTAHTWYFGIASRPRFVSAIERLD